MQQEEPACKQGVGNIDETTTKVCRTTPTDDFDRFIMNEAECIFPFYLDGEEQKECTPSIEKDFRRPQFICPIRTLKGRGTNYTTDDIDTTYCPTNYNSSIYATPKFTSRPVFSPNRQWELDPDNENCIDEEKKSAFATCKNTCPGGEKIFNLVIIFRW